MWPFKRARKRASATPMLDRRIAAGFWPGLFSTLAIPTLLVGLLAWFGQPALRIQYEYTGSHDHYPVFQRCLYLSLDGWHDTRPFPAIGACPVVTLFPIDIIGFLGGAS